MSLAPGLHVQDGLLLIRYSMCFENRQVCCRFGIGTIMLSTCEHVVQDFARCDRVSLHVDADIVPFYVNSGYTVVKHGGFLSLFKSEPVVMTKLI